jgi:HlyD family secretion protein
LAVLDTTVLAASVRDAQANLDRAEAQFQQATTEYELQKPLLEKGFISQLEFLPVETNLAVTKAAVVSAKSAIERARTNLGYSTIEAPIDGTIIERSVDAGQTVAASFSTPTLFVIAQDLSKMEIFASVDESDIGEIHTEQKVNFTVQAYPDEQFFGIAKQIRLQPTTISNVVNYTVVITASNEKGLLMPGMTATVDFVIEEVNDVLRVPNGALRFEPDTEQLKLLGFDKMNGRFGHKTGGNSNRGSNEGGASRLPADSLVTRTEQALKNLGRIWFLDGTGKLAFTVVRTGITDGKLTEVRGKEELVEGMKVITGVSAQSSALDKSVSLFQGMRPPRGMH